MVVHSAWVFASVCRCMPPEVVRISQREKSPTISFILLFYATFSNSSNTHKFMIQKIILKYLMAKMINRHKLKNSLETWKVLVFQALEIPFLSNLNQLVVENILDFLQKSTMVNHIWIFNNTFKLIVYSKS